ncbi:hypothetical protein MBLNU230_g1547t1 [Neophaeotheca triangularis]
MGGFATTLLTVSLAMMEFRGVHVQTVFVGNLCFVAGIGLLISAQWEMARGNTFSYTVLQSFGLFYSGYGAIMIPVLGIADAYGGDDTPEYYNAMVWAVLNIFFLIASMPFNIVYILIFTTVELCFALDASSYFARADGKIATSDALMKSAGVFGFISGLLGYYTTLHYLCSHALPFRVPMGDTSKYFARMKHGRL